jgi:integrase
MASIYVREKVQGIWKQRAIKEGVRGFRTAHLIELGPPFYARPVIDGQQEWVELQAQTYEDAKSEIKQLAGTGKSAPLLAGKTPVSVAVERFLADVRRTRKSSTLQDYTLHLKHFVESTNIEYVEQATAATVERYRDWMQEQGYSAKTQNTRALTVLSLLKRNNVKTKFSITTDLPRVEEEPAVPYTDEEIKKLFSAMDDEEKIRYEFFLGTGCRDKEVTFCAWSDLNLETGEYHVRRKEDVGFTPKSHQSRVVPMPTRLVKMLKDRKKNRKHERWVFVNEDGVPDNHFLRKLKRIALRSGLNCGQCRTTLTRGKYHTKRTEEVSCADQPVCQHIYLHRFRKTCATRWQQAGVPIRDIQLWLGHKSLEVTQRYLGATPTHQLRNLIDKAAGD